MSYLRLPLNPFYILTFFSCLYLTQIVPISPFYFGLLLSFVIFFICISIRPKYKILLKSNSILIAICIIISFYIFISALINELSLKYPILQILSYIFLLFSYFVTIQNPKTIRKVFKHLIIVVEILLLIELFYRITHPKFFSWANDFTNFFYIYKFSSIMFLDTNETGFFILIFLSFMLYLHKENILFIPRFTFIVFFCFLVFSFSRAAILGFLVLISYTNIFRSLSTIKKFFIINLLCVMLILIIMILLNDVSFLSKIDIFNKTYLYLSDTTVVRFLFGVGMYNSTKVLGGIYGHNYISLYWIEYGFIGLLLFLLFLLLILLANNKTYYLLIPFLVTGLSFFPYFCPYLFFFLGLIINLEKIKKKD